MTKHRKFLSLVLALTLLLCGCAGSGMIDNPKTMADGSAWDDTWTNLGGRLGAEAPGAPFQLLSSNGRLEGMELHYATWVCGQEQKLDKDTYVYDGQIYLMTESCGTQEQASETLAQWRGQLTGDFAITKEASFTAGGVEYTLVFYDCLASDSHFSRGVTALGLWQDLVIITDIACVEGLELDLAGTMEQFLQGIHLV